jgi:transcriptional regulator with XRE-family HTH domain
MSRSRNGLVASDEQVSSVALGARLRASRLDRGMSLADVSKATGISTSFLSLVEKGETDITLGRLFALLGFYGLAAAEVLGDVGPGDDEVIVPEGEASYLFSVGAGMEMYHLSPDRRRRPFFPVLGVYEPGATMDEFSEHDGEEFLHVLDGSIELELEGSEPRVLRKGDSAMFSARRPHRIATHGKRTARVLTVTSESFLP